MGFSQGNSVIRGYIQKYNDPPVATFLSVHGTVMGTSSFPQCNPDGSKLCTDLAELLGDLAYNELVQNILFQANYFRDPQLESSSAYLRTSQIAAWNNATRTAPSVWRSNFAKTKKFAMIKALKDTMIFPNEGEWWGQFAPGSFNKVQAMKDTPDYLNNTFGLRTADEAGKLSFETTAGNHLQFTEEQLMGWVDKYFSKSF